MELPTSTGVMGNGVVKARMLTTEFWINNPEVMRFSANRRIPESGNLLKIVYTIYKFLVSTSGS